MKNTLRDSIADYRMQKNRLAIWRTGQWKTTKPNNKKKKGIKGMKES